MRAAVLVSSEQAMTASDGLDAMPSFSPNSGRSVRTRLVVLPPGIRAAALGRGALRPGAPEWAEAGLGEQQVVESRLPNWAALVLSKAGKDRDFDDHVIPGPIDVPVLTDPATGLVHALDVDALLAEVAPYRETAVRIWKAEDGWLRTPRAVLGAPRSAVHFVRGLGGAWHEALSDLAADLRSEPAPGPEAGERPTDESHGPIEGVGYRTWVTVRAGLVRDAVHPTHVEPYATHRGVPPARWAAIDAAWTERAAADPRVGVWSAHDLRRLSPTGARW